MGEDVGADAEDARGLPPTQILAALRRARLAGLPFEDAWRRAVQGEVCDGYQSARSKTPDEWPEGDDGSIPPGLRASSDQARCAGCRFMGPAFVCGAFGVRVYPGVRWPSQTDQRREWKAATEFAREEWRAAYEGWWTPLGVRIAALSTRDGAVSAAGEIPRARRTI